MSVYDINRIRVPDAPAEYDDDTADTHYVPAPCQVACPVVIVHGKDDMLVPYANVAFMKTAFESAERVEVIAIDGENHFLPWTQEALVRQTIEREFGGVAGSRAMVPHVLPRGGLEAENESVR